MGTLALVVGRRTANGEPELLGCHRVGRRPSTRAARLGRWDDPESRFAFASGPRVRKLRNVAANPQAVIMVDDTVECVSVEGRAAPVRNDERRDQWIERYLAKYQSIAPDLSAEFLGRNVLVEFAAELAFGVIEREEEFSTRPTRWVFDAAG